MKDVIEEKSPPCGDVVLSTTFHLTHQCNLRCVYCYTGAKVGRSMSWDIARRSVAFVLSEAQRRKVRYLDVTFFGGEPLLELQLMLGIAELVEREKGVLEVSYRLSTNGVLIFDEVLAKINQYSMYVSLSIDGPPDVHDQHRPNAAGKGTSDRVAAAAALLLQSNPFAHCTSVLRPETAHRAHNCVQWVYSLGFRYITLTLDYSAPWTAETMQQLEQSFHVLADWYKERIRSGDRFYLSCIDERINTHTRPPCSPEEKCGLGIRQFSIAPDGTLYPCIQFVRTEGLPEFAIGDVFGGIDREKARHLYTVSTQSKDECRGCKLHSRCGSWCACVNYASTGTISEASPVICHYERVTMPIVDRLAAELFRERNALFLQKHYNPAYALIDALERLT